MSDIAQQMDNLTNDLREILQDSDREAINALIPHMQALKTQLHRLSVRECWERCGGDWDCLAGCLSNSDL